jgi:hypothetical protein
MFLISLLAIHGTREKSLKINGASLVAPHDSTVIVNLTDVHQIKANWVAVIPFAFSRKGTPGVTFNHERQWWGEKPEAIRQTIRLAHENNLKVMLKPHVWVSGEGWPGEYDLKTEQDWTTWEETYAAYILFHAALASEMKADLYCIGTEYRIAVRKRPEFWKKLITEVRKVYHGPLTYAANWDNYENVTFWKELDYIGIDAYFPVSVQKTPTKEELLNNWNKIERKLHDFSRTQKRPVLFTEYGYRSVDYTADGHWKYSLDTLSSNMQGQVNSYEALLENFWDEPWVAGGFLWKWHLQIENRPGFMEKDYSPQGKPVIQTIRKYYSQP